MKEEEKVVKKLVQKREESMDRSEEQSNLKSGEDGKETPKQEGEVQSQDLEESVNKDQTQSTPDNVNMTPEEAAHITRARLEGMSQLGNGFQLIGAGTCELGHGTQEELEVSGGVLECGGLSAIDVEVNDFELRQPAAEQESQNIRMLAPPGVDIDLRVERSGELIERPLDPRVVDLQPKPVKPKSGRRANDLSPAPPHDPSRLFHSDALLMKDILQDSSLPPAVHRAIDAPLLAAVVQVCNTEAPLKNQRGVL
eukprot:CAMPEP_0196594610 /NCGR_PEP_ID=MMETSP1081-20130531/78800_1 /TAXON_ID=36882 /ORGANISM="Pyramimonas amylifera, Strain CCMP720" /LENGTH=253 /DNA_ID=CAMNT_0041918915 /DNA_START=10 /DNA_END=771 /DNA_ORIENTATION=+